MISNKYIKIQFFLFSLATLASVAIFSKYFVFLIHETVVYCQKIISQPDLIIKTPHMIAIILATLVAFYVFSIFVIRLVREYYLVGKLAKGHLSMPYKLKKIIARNNLELTSICLFNSSKYHAFCFGILKPKIYISTALVNDLKRVELEAIILHEHYHLKERHTIVLTLSKFISSVFSFFPIFSEIHDLIREHQEVMADKFVVDKLQSPKPLLIVFKKLLLTHPQHLISLSLPIYEENTIENRIRRLKNLESISKRFSPIKLVASMISTFLLTFFLILPVNATEVHANGQDVMMICFNNKMCQMSCEKDLEKSENIPNQSVSNPFTPVN